MKEVDWSFIHGKGTIICNCDECGMEHEDEFDNGCPDYKACQEELKTYGWVSKKIDENWYDFCCKDCYQKFIKNK